MAEAGQHARCSVIDRALVKGLLEVSLYFHVVLTGRLLLLGEVGLDLLLLVDFPHKLIALRLDLVLVPLQLGNELSHLFLVLLLFAEFLLEYVAALFKLIAVVHNVLDFTLNVAVCLR